MTNEPDLNDVLRRLKGPQGDRAMKAKAIAALHWYAARVVSLESQLADLLEEGASADADGACNALNSELRASLAQRRPRRRR
jgi:hypothetical protein